jgi:hypothetical protein
MQKNFSRRAIVKGGLLMGALVPALGMIAEQAAAADLPPLDSNDPTAKALGFVPDTTKVDDKANPTHKTEQKCANCAQFQGKPTDARGGCNIFVGKSVPSGGWCKTWAKKAS